VTDEESEKTGVSATMSFDADPSAAAYGLFHVAFASLDTRITYSLVDLCRCKERDFAISIVTGLPFGKRLQFLEAAVKRLARKLSAVDQETLDELDRLKTACEAAGRVGKWRNTRIHAEVRLDTGFNVFYDRDGNRVFIERSDCDLMRNDAAIARDTMAECVPLLVSMMDLKAKISELLGDIEPESLGQEN
jgi:hypothetical protein